MILPLLCAILGTVLIMSPDSIIPYDTQNNILKTIYDNNKIFGAAFFVIAFLIYKKPSPKTYIDSDVSDLPTYTESEMTQTTPLNSSDS